MTKTCIVIPCYNEANRLPVATIRQFSLENPQLHFLLVDDGSEDGTLSTLWELGDANPAGITVMNLPVNHGKAEAVRRGCVHAIHEGYKRVGYWDADLATPLPAIHTLNAILDGHPELDLVMGSRVKLLGRKIIRNELRHYCGRVFATAASIFLRLAVYDTQCGAKILRVNSHTEHLFDLPFVSRWIFDIEIIARLAKEHQKTEAKTPLNTVIYEYPLTEWMDVKGSKIRYSDVFCVMVDYVRLWWTAR